MHWGSLVAVAALALGMAACGDDDDERSGTASSGTVRPVPGFDGRTIELGALTPLTGPVAVIGRALTAGNEVHFAAVNAKGGIGGRYRVRLVKDDTQYRADETVRKYNKLKGDVVAFTQILGTAPTLAVLPQVVRDGMVASPASGDAFWVREPNLLPIGAPYQVQAVNALDYYVTDGGGKGKRICTLVQHDVYGEAAQEGVDFAAGRLTFDVETKQRFKLGDSDMTGQVQRLRRTGCEAVFLAATPGDAATIWGTAAKLGYAPRWIALGPSWIGALAKSPLKDYLAKTTWIAAEGTEWGDDAVPGMRQLLADVDRHRPEQPADYYFVYGYNQARAMTALLEKAVELGDLSRKGVLEASRQLATVPFAGLTDDYRYGPAEQRDPPRASTVFEVDPDKPFGLGRLAYQHESEAAREFRFEKAEL